MNRFKLSHKDITPDMDSVTDESVHYWAFLYWRGELEIFEESLGVAEAEEQISFFRYCVIEAKKIIVELYNKLVEMSEFNQELIRKPEWMDEFLAE